MYCHYPRVNTRKDNKKQMGMKKLLIALVIGLIGYACSEEKVGVYSLERDYIYFQYESSRLGTTMNVADSVYLYYNSSSVSVNSSRQRDTFFFRVKVAGMARSVDRKINIEPYSFLTNGREEAIAGVNYVAFDDPEMEKCCVVPADSVSVNIPIIVTYNPAIAGSYKGFMLAFKLVDSDDFEIMATNPNLSANPARTHAFVQFTQSN